jgi:hypothetical protein
MTNIGVAAAVNITSQNNQAFIGGAVTAPAITVEALLGGDGVATFNAEAHTGAGSAAGLGVAGAFAVNLSVQLEGVNPINIPIPDIPPGALSVDSVAGVTGNQLTIVNHGRATGDPVTYDIGLDDENIGGLVDGGIYYVRVITPNTLELYNTCADAMAGTNRINLTPTVGPATHKLQPPLFPPPCLPAPFPDLPILPTPTVPTLPTIPAPTGGTHIAAIQTGANLTLTNGGDLIVRSEFEGDYNATTDSTPPALALDFDPVNDVDDANEQLLIVGHGLATGTQVAYSAEGDDETVGDLNDGQFYYVRAVSADAVELYLSAEEAVAGENPIDLRPTTNNGDGDHRLTPPAFAVGVGPSIASNAISQEVKAEIQSGTTINGPGLGGGGTNITVEAAGVYNVDAHSLAGATAAVGLPAAVAMNYTDFKTTARAAGTASISGSLFVDADHAATTTHVADTDSQGGTLSIGPAIAIGFVEGGASASSAMSLLAPLGNAHVTSNNDSFLDALSTSGSEGAEGDAEGDPVPARVQNQIANLLALAGKPDIPVEVLEVLARAGAETADGPVGLAAAIAANLDYGFSRAALESGGSITVAFSPDVEATGDMDVTAFADATSVNSGLGVGVAVALNLDGQVIESAIGGVVNAPSIELQTNAGSVNSFNATAFSGGGGGDISVAGAFALNISGNPLAVEDPLDLLVPSGGGQHNARILPGATLNVTPGNDVSVEASYVGEYNATATSTPGVGTVGVGPSVAINIIRHETLAEIGANVTFIDVNNITVEATGVYTTNTSAVAGADNNGGLPAAIALTATLNNTTAQVLSSNVLSNIGGNLEVTATHSATTNTVADAELAGAQVGLGAAIAAGGPQGGAIALGGGNLDLPGNVTIEANTTSTANADAFAAQAGSLVSGLTVDQETQRQLKRLAEMADVDQLLFPFIDSTPPLEAIIDANGDIDGVNDTIKLDTPHEFDTGDAAVYHNNQDAVNIGPALADGDVVYISVNAGDPSRMRSPVRIRSISFPWLSRWITTLSWRKTCSIREQLSPPARTRLMSVSLPASLRAMPSSISMAATIASMVCRTAGATTCASMPPT